MGGNAMSDIIEPTIIEEPQDVKAGDMIQEFKSNKERDYKAQSAKFNVLTRQRHLLNEIIQSFKNYEAIDRAFKDGKGVDLGNLPKHKGVPILILGSGPSFDLAAPFLKNWKGAIMASTSQAVTCIYHGHPPEYIMALDPDCKSDELKPTPKPWNEYNTILLHHPGVSNNLVGWWPGKRGFFRKLEPQTPFFGNAQKIGYADIRREIDPRGRLTLMEVTPRIRTEIVMLGCALNAQIFAATQMEYSPLFMVGTDFGFPENRGRFTEWSYKEKKKLVGYHTAEEENIDGDWSSYFPPLIEARSNDMVADNGCPSDSLQLYYKKNFISAWRLDKANIINCSKGAVSEPPYAPIDKVIECQGDLSKMADIVKPYTEREIIEKAEGYLAQHNTFIVRFKAEKDKLAGIQFVEFGDIDEIPKYMKEIARQGVKNISYNETIEAVKNIAKQGYLEKEDVDKIMSWETIDESALHETRQMKTIKLHPGMTLDENTIGDAKLMRDAITESIKKAEEKKNALETS